MGATNAERTPEGWGGALDEIERSLRRSLERATDPEPPPPPSGAPGASLRRLDERLAAWQGGLERVERQAQAADERLAAEQAALSGWLDRLGQVRQGFTAWLEGQAGRAA